MGVFTGSFRARDSQANSASGVCETFNYLHAAFIGCGMEQVADEDYAGQAGTLVTGTPGAGETQVTLGSSSGSGTLYYNVYKHPGRNLWVRMEVTDFGFATTTSRFSRVSYTVSHALEGGAFPVGQFQTVHPIATITSGTNISTAIVSSSVMALYASCGDDHFWIGSASNCTVSSSSSATAHYPDGLTSCGFGVFYSESGAALMLSAPPASMSSNVAGAALASDVGATRYWTCESGSTAWIYRGPGTARALSDPATPSSAAGTRVQQASIIIGGTTEDFNFGTAQAAALTEGGLISVNLRGEGDESYRAMRSFGPATPANQASTTSNIAALLLPWAAE